MNNHFKNNNFNTHDELNYKEIDAARFNFVLNSIEGYARPMVMARILMCLGVAFFNGFLAAIAVFLGFELVKQATKNFASIIKSEYDAGRMELERAETLLTIHPMARALSVGIVYILLANAHVDHAEEAGLLLLVGNLAFQIYQNSNSAKLLIGSIAVSIIAILGHTIWDSYLYMSIAPLVAPFLFSIVMSALGYLAFKDRERALFTRHEMMSKAERLENLIKFQVKDTKTRENVERLAGVGTYIWEFSTNEIKWSAGAFKAFGFDENKPIPSKPEFVNRIDEKDKAKYIETMRKCRVNGENIEFGFTIRGADEILHYVWCHGETLRDDDGNAIGMEGIVIDQSKAQAAIEESNSAKELLHMALTNGRPAVIERDFATGEMRGYGALDIFDFHPEDDMKYLEDKVLKCLGRRDTHIVFGAMGRAEASGEIQFAEHRIIHADGKEINVRVAMGVEGQMASGKGHMVSITTDITEEVNRREELRKALEESTRASRVKSEFLANMSHEIRTPLNGVIALTGLLAKTKLDKNQYDMVQLIENSGGALSHIINDVLDLARVESGRLEIEKIEFNLKDALQSATSLFGVKADEKGLAFKVDIDEAANHFFLGDPIRIRQIIGNLLSNAIKFTQEGSVSLHGRLVKNEKEPNAYSCTFTVKDTGDGMSEDAQSRLFERFEQADGSITRKHGGSGLGLAISRSLANLMGGDIVVTSAIGLGSAFTFSLPLTMTEKLVVEKAGFDENYEAVPNSFSETESETREENEGALCVLAVDDNATNRKVFDLVLSPMGIDLTLCENGLEAFETYKLKHFDVILMDMQMPIMDGLTATRKIREFEHDFTNRHIPIIVVSANAMSHHVEEAIEAGADMHIAKPFTPQSLIEGIEKGLAFNDNFANDDGQEVA